MNEIIDYLMRNIGLLIVVGGFVLTFLAKVRNAKGGGSRSPQSGKPNPMMPPFGGGARLDPKPRPQTSAQGSEERTNGHTAGETVGRDQTSSVHARRSSDFTDGAQAREAVEGREDREMEVTENDALRGMIWAEIMGAPRSKKPYRPRNG